jgi:4-amino-4-deoxy-L-arabinose transferase-like glycosyltransferase
MSTSAPTAQPIVPAVRTTASWRGPILWLLPILGLYVLVTAVHPLASGYGDEGAYLAYARNLTHGFFTQPGQVTIAAYLWHGPALPLLLAPIVALHLPLAVTRVLVSPLPLFAAIVVFHQMVRPYLRERSALIATYAVAVYLPFFPSIRAVQVEPLATLCFTLVVFFMVRAFRGGRRDHVWAGIAFAVLALSRVEFGYVLLVALLASAVWLLMSRRSSLARRSVVACAVALVLCVPWLAYTYSVTGKPLYWGNSGGLSLYWMSAPGNLGDWHTVKQGLTQANLAANRPDLTAVARLKPLAQDSRLLHIAIENIRHHPKHYLSNLVNNVDRLVFNSPYSFTNEKASSMLYAVPNAILLGALVLACLIAVRTRRRLGAELVPIAVLLVLAFVVHVPVAAYARFVVPLVPAAAWLIFAVVAPVWPAAASLSTSPVNGGRPLTMPYPERDAPPVSRS